MSRAASPFAGRLYGVVRVTREWEMARSSFYYQLRIAAQPERDRKSTRLNSSHGYISYAVFCLKKKKKKEKRHRSVELRNEHEQDTSAQPEVSNADHHPE